MNQGQFFFTGCMPSLMDQLSQNDGVTAKGTKLKFLQTTLALCIWQVQKKKKNIAIFQGKIKLLFKIMR